MKRTLICTSALVAAGLLAGAGAANAADPIKIGASGGMSGAIAWISEDDGAGQAGADTRSMAIQLDSEIRFRGSTTLDNGTEWGVKIEVTSDTNAVTIDEHMMYVENEESWGRIELGDEDDASDQFRQLGPFVIGSAITGCSTFSGVTNATGKLPFVCIGFGGDNTKITYRGPKIAGIQWGVSYIPSMGGFTTLAGSRGANDTGEQENVVAVGANWNGSAGEASIAVGGGWANAPAEFAGERDENEWHVGVRISQGPWAVGGSWKNQEAGPPTADDRDIINYRVGLTYRMATTTVGVEYFESTNEELTGQDDVITAYSVAANRTLGPGISAGAMLRTWDFKDDAASAAIDNQATEFLLITSVGF